MGRLKFIGGISPDLIAWKIEARDALKCVKIVVKSSVPVWELLEEEKKFLEAWVPNLEDVFMGEDFDSDILGVYILKDGGVYIGFEVQSEFIKPHIFYSPVMPQDNLGLTVEVYCQELKLTDHYTVYYDEHSTRLVECALSSNDRPVEMRTIPLDINPNLSFCSNWPEKTEPAS